MSDWPADSLSSAAGSSEKICFAHSCDDCMMPTPHMRAPPSSLEGRGEAAKCEENANKWQIAAGRHLLMRRALTRHALDCKLSPRGLLQHPPALSVIGTGVREAESHMT